ncbi:hypothetical protein [Candidatus Albibeggiatoa sp. nov. BB20]|uniref:hypothetical protein n=1 Tax=Candidatus Albibeggiatoa sp. nov. BB20 TaxID=3162723 RepID=UPI003365644F
MFLEIFFEIITILGSTIALLFGTNFFYVDRKLQTKVSEDIRETERQAFIEKPEKELEEKLQKLIQ